MAAVVGDVILVIARQTEGGNVFIALGVLTRCLVVLIVSAVIHVDHRNLWNKQVGYTTLIEKLLKEYVLYLIISCCAGTMHIKNFKLTSYSQLNFFLKKIIL